MTNPPDQRHITLVVTNPRALRLGSVARYSFDQSGGAIGSNNADWIITDGRDSVRPLHCQIHWEDGAFCLIDRSGQTRINDNQDPLGQDVSVRLREGDCLHIGPFAVIVQLEQDNHPLPDPRRHLSEHSIDELLHAGGVAVTNDLPSTHVEALDADPSVQNNDPLRALMQPLDHAMLDPLQALDAAAAAQKPVSTPAHLDPRHYGLSAGTTPPDLSNTRFEATSGLSEPSIGNNRMSRDASPHPSQAWLNTALANSGDPAQLTLPFIEGLGASVGPLDAQTSYQLLFEAGQTIAALVRGLAAIHQTEHGAEPKHLSLQGRTLQPIEDNPLRLGLSYADTIQALFSKQRSLVHLAPQAAVEESLSQLQRHQHAIVKGIEAGLTALLQAFSPLQLIDRFRRYQPEQLSAAQQGEWAWQMYAHYYNELVSGRQKGFEKLFWEIFDQHYDKSIRSETP